MNENSVEIAVEVENIEFLTGYKLANAINEMLKSRGLKEIPPQMIYNYKRKGYIKSVDVNGQNLVSVEEAELFAEKYVAKKLAQSV